MTEPREPLALVYNTLLLVSVGAPSLSESIDNLPFVEAGVSPVVSSVAGYFVLSELALVAGAVGPDELAFAVEEAVLHFSLECVTLAEFASALAMIHLANLTVLLEIDDVTRPVLNNQLRKLSGQESNLR